MRLPPTLSAATAAVGALLLHAPVALAARDPHGEDTPLRLPEDDPVQRADIGGGSGGGLVRLVVGLAIVIGVIYGLAWVLRQLRASRVVSGAGARGLEPLGSAALGPGRAVHLVRAGAEIHLLGVSEHGVTPIRTYEEHEARSQGLIPDEDDEGPGPRAGFRSPPALAGVVEELRRRTARS